eukprot:1039807_1
MISAVHSHSMLNSVSIHDVSRNESNSELLSARYQRSNWGFTKRNWKQQCFLIFWSLGSGYGVIFAIMSFLFEHFQFDSAMWTLIKGFIALIIGIPIGFIHFSLTVDDGSPRAHPIVLDLISKGKVHLVFYNNHIPIFTYFR